MFGDLNSGLWASTAGPFVRIDVESDRLFELMLGFIAAAAAARIPLDAASPSLLLINGATVNADADDDAVTATVATGDCCCC